MSGSAISDNATEPYEHLPVDLVLREHRGVRAQAGRAEPRLCEGDSVKGVRSAQKMASWPMHSWGNGNAAMKG